MDENPPHDQRKNQNGENHANDAADGTGRAVQMRGRDCVGDSHGSDCGKVGDAPVGRKGVDLEISGKIPSHETNSPTRLMSPTGGVKVAIHTTSESDPGVAKAAEVRRNLLDGRKRGSSDAPRQQKVNYSHNLQYLEIVSPPEEELQSRSIPEVQSHINLAEEVANKQRKQQRQQLYAQLKKQIFRDRLQTVRKMAANPIYVNANFERPWRTVSTISDQLVDELLAEVADQGLDFGEESFVEEFLRLQLAG
ncbi:uncharacterized protein LOC129761959 [Toxorhynchites rutilus septentrionalis]|uniref:uncharacterized protein LOC129761959 n=1 Tax=Toxorhynchites rutilus septentrionalis TaxID=329112 RepID=UPI002479BD4E|nr:uncharacterized protein LOC129761959 [Toxorhynchites rutilus septentrionalis]